jgi:hypothetical protein
MNCPFSWNAGSARMRSRTSASLALMPRRFASASDASSWIICWTMR